MKRKKNRFVVIFAVVLVLAVVVFVLGALFGGPKNIEDGYTKYNCDVKNLRFNTEIEIKNNGTKVGTVTGNILAIVTDPLTLKDASGNKVAYAGDEYHFLAQDTHSIYLDDGLAVEMVGKVNLFGDTYDIYDSNQNKIATVSFNILDTAGEMYDENKNLIATYSAWPFMNDYTVKISDNCKIDDNAALMIFASYYSDRSADSRSSSSHSSNNNK